MLRKWLKKFRKVGLIFLGIGGVLLFYTVAIEPGRLVLHEETITINHWDKSLNGFKVVAISDIHGGAIFMDETKLRQIVELSNAQNPDIIVLLGDYVSQSEGRGSQALKMPTETLAQNLVGLT